LLARPADSITVGEVLRALENIRAQGRSRPNDPFADIWRRIDGAVSEVLDHTSFGDLARNWQEKQAKYVPDWDI
jgi:DNA-binding IscR family transcriptional regulator